VFLSPKSDMARQLILPRSEADGGLSETRGVRLVFDGHSAFEPIISDLTLECRTPVNILAANTKNINGLAYGQMVLQLPGDEDAAARAKAFLDARNVHWEEVDLHAE
jgi:D-methionine transport system ATP-binding protein